MFYIHKRVTYALLLNLSDQKIPRKPLTINVFLQNEIGVDRKTYVMFFFLKRIKYDL